MIMTYGPYGKWLHFEDLYSEQWRLMCENHPEVPAGSTNKYQCWEVVDPEKWVPDGYVCIRVDSRGAGRSPGIIDIWSLREAQDLAHCVDWAGVQPWSNGKVGLNGISYYGQNQWQTAALQPKHLAAICTWEAAADFYRDMAHHGGIFCNGFTHDWSRAQVYSVQHGRGTRGFKSRMTGDWVSGPITLSEEELGANRRNFYEDCLAHKLDTDEYWQIAHAGLVEGEDAAALDRQLGRPGPASARQFRGLRSRRFERQMARGTRARALDAFLHRLRRRLQKKFFGHFLKGEETGWDKQPKVLLQVRHPGRVRRAARERVAARAHAVDQALSRPGRLFAADKPQAKAVAVTYAGFGDGVTFMTAPLSGNRDHRADRRQAVGLVVDAGCRPVPGGARVRARHEGGGVPRRARSAHADGAGLAARVAPQARREAHPALPAVPHPR